MPSIVVEYCPVFIQTSNFELDPKNISGTLQCGQFNTIKIDGELIFFKDSTKYSLKKDIHHYLSNNKIYLDFIDKNKEFYYNESHRYLSRIIGDDPILGYALIKMNFFMSLIYDYIASKHNIIFSDFSYKDSNIKVSFIYDNKSIINHNYILSMNELNMPFPEDPNKRPMAIYEYYYKNVSYFKKLFNINDTSRNIFINIYEVIFNAPIEPEILLKSINKDDIISKLKTENKNLHETLNSLKKGFENFTEVKDSIEQELIEAIISLKKEIIYLSETKDLIEQEKKEIENLAEAKDSIEQELFKAIISLKKETENLAEAKDLIEQELAETLAENKKLSILNEQKDNLIVEYDLSKSDQSPPSYE